MERTLRIGLASVCACLLLIAGLLIALIGEVRGSGGLTRFGVIAGLIAAGVAVGTGWFSDGTPATAERTAGVSPGTPPA